jgi:redox-sensitive bicupin YhaK (pirin superfamily)
MVVDPTEFAAYVAFFVLMVDGVDLALCAHVGGEHPHAGFEIATFVVEGALIDRDEGVLRAGDLLWTRAGRGIIHNEEVTTEGRTRILQLWRALPVEERWSEPWFETTTLHEAPARRESGAEVIVYAGRSGSVSAPSGRHAPMTLVDVRLERGAAIEQEVPATFAAFAYVLDGTVVAGDEGTVLRTGQAAWLDVGARAEGESVVRLAATDDDGARVVVYAAPPIGEPIASHGPFVGGSRVVLMRVSRDYMEGRFVRMSEL